MNNPAISVVMAAYNAAERLGSTLISLEMQQQELGEIGLECVIVNDGSDDETGLILDRWAAAGSQRRIIHQDNLGLTAALIKGCELSRGRMIARQDAGDQSLSGRLTCQLEILTSDPSVSLVSCGTRFVDQDGDLLYQSALDPQSAEQGLFDPDPDRIIGPPHHGGVMFRRSDYLAAGGYRPEFYVAQDLDLWLRIADIGRHASIPEVYYQADASVDAISQTRRHLQQQVTGLIVESRQLRKAGKSDQAVLNRVSQVSRSAPRKNRQAASNYYYFIAGCLRKHKPRKALSNYRRALVANPLNIKAALRLMQTAFELLHRPKAVN